jgi:N-acetylglutamate synthase-like GNAT family acetyltransferase
MNPGPLRIRRATVDDLPALRALWSAQQLDADALESRLTEFQVVEAGGVFAGAIGVQIVRQHALLHSEDYSDFSVADAARELFWERIQTLAANHGVFRVWTRETSPFWKRWGFQPASAEILERLPDEWKWLESESGLGAPKRSEGGWLTQELKNEDAINAALKDRFAGFMDAEKKQTAQLAAHAKRLKTVITVAGFAIFFVCLAVAIWLLRHHPLAGR